nr:hypothetical protein [Ruegeria sp. HKCCA6837]
MLQVVWLFSWSVRDNIASDAIRPKDYDLIEAGRTSGVEDFVIKHPNGYDLQLAEYGEGQAIALARALVGHPPVLLLEEPISEIDFQTEAQVIQRLKKTAAETTMVIVTPRTSLLVLLDGVLILEDGEIAADAC